MILQEIGQALDTPDDIIFDWLQEKGLSRIIRWAAPFWAPKNGCRAFSRGPICSDFVGQHYRPGQMILSAAGRGRSRGTGQRWPRQLFGDMAAARSFRQRSRRGLPGAKAGHVKTLSRRISRWRLKARITPTPSIYTAQIYASALGGSMSSRLFQEVREKARALLHDLRPGRGLCRYRHDHDLRRHLRRADGRSGADHRGRDETRRSR